MKKFLHFFLRGFCTLVALCGTAARADNGIVGGKLNAPVNTALNDYSPVVLLSMDAKGEDRLYFTSERTDIYEKGKVKKKARRAEMWYSSRPASDRDAKPLNEGWCNPACQLVSTDDEQFPAYTRGAMTMDESRTVVIFASEQALVKGKLDGGNTSHMFDLWSTTDNFATVTPIEAVNSDYWDSHPALTPDGGVLFFTSNRPVVLNGKPDSSLNIFYARHTHNGGWSKALLVPGINTPGDEVSPHCGVDGYFYYASNWKGEAIADHDMYRAPLNSSGIPVQPLVLEESLARTMQRGIPDGFRYNSAANDLFPFVSPDKRGLFFASDRDSNGLDIYAYNFPKPVIQLEVTVLEQVVDYNGKIIQAWTPKRQKLHIVGRETATIESGVPVELEPHTSYRITSPLPDSLCFACESVPTTLQIATSSEDAVVRDTFRILCRQQPDTAVVFSDAETGTPYFITGYWWPNTSKNLAEFRSREQNGYLRQSTFVDASDFNYNEAAKKIDEHFEQNIYHRIETIMQQISSQCWSKPILLITVHGYTDECSLRPGFYTYDPTVTVGDIVIPKGQNMQSTYATHITGGTTALPDSGQNGNIFLSKLRAYYTIETIKNTMMERSQLFQQLVESKQIQFDADGFGVFGKKSCDYLFAVPDLGLPATPIADEPCNKPRSRMFTVYFTILTPDQVSDFRIGRCGKQSPQYVQWLQRWQKQKQHDMALASQREKEEQERQQQKQQSQGTTVAAGSLYSIYYGAAGNEEELRITESILTMLGYEYLPPTHNEDGGYRLISPPQYTNEEEAEQALAAYRAKAESLRRLLQPVIVQQ